jgi:hypothetical protein
MGKESLPINKDANLFILTGRLSIFSDDLLGVGITHPAVPSLTMP